MPEPVTIQKKDGAVARFTVILFASFFLFNSIDSPIPGISVGELVLAMGTALSFFDGKGSFLQIHSIHKDMLGLALVCLVITLVVAPFQPVFSVKDFVIRAIRWFFYIGCAMVLGKRVDPKQLCDVFFLIAVVASIFLIFQVVVYQTTGRAITLRIGEQTLGCAVENIYTSGKLSGRIFRFSSFFSEPAHFSYYVILTLAIELLYREALDLDLRTIAGIAIIFLALIYCTSTYAILLIAILILSFLSLFLKYHGVSRRSVLWAVLLLLVSILVLFIFRKSFLGSYLIKKISSVGNTSRTSFVWEQGDLFPDLQKWFGVGIGNEETYYSYMANAEMGYVNSFSLIFLYCGFTGVVLILLFYAKSWIESQSHARIFLVLFAATSLYSTAFFSTVMVLYTVVIAAGDNMTIWCGNEGSEQSS